MAEGGEGGLYFLTTGNTKPQIFRGVDISLLRGMMSSPGLLLNSTLFSVTLKCVEAFILGRDLPVFFEGKTLTLELNNQCMLNTYYLLEIFKPTAGTFRRFSV